MQIEVNGERRECAEGISLAAFIETQGLAGRRLAVERNGTIVPRSSWGATRLEAGDRIEIVHAIGGG